MNKCSKCGKQLSNKYYLKKHIETCKGVINPLECHICHNLFAFSSSKSVHLKQCKIKNLKETTEIIESPDITLINSDIELTPSTTNITSNIIQLNQIYKKTYYNDKIVNLCFYDKKTGKINFDISHFNEEIMYIILKNNNDDAFDYLSDKLFENVKNKLVLKNNIKDNYSEVHIGANYWEIMLDYDIYPKIMSNICNTFIKFYRRQ